MQEQGCELLEWGFRRATIHHHRRWGRSCRWGWKAWRPVPIYGCSALFLGQDAWSSDAQVGGHIGKLRLKPAWNSPGEWEGELVKDCHLPVATLRTPVLILLSWLCLDAQEGNRWGSHEVRQPCAQVGSPWDTEERGTISLRAAGHFWIRGRVRTRSKDPGVASVSAWRCLCAIGKTWKGQGPMMTGLIQ